jgi:signal transduction histidine kinase/CheY-like chemotaxis protein
VGSLLEGQFDYPLYAGASLLALAALWEWRRRAGARCAYAAVATAITGVLLGGGWVAVESVSRHEREEVSAMLTSVAPTYAEELEARGHWRLPDVPAPDDPLYVTLLESQKRWLRLNRNIADIYTLRRGADGAWRFLVDSETDYNHDGRYGEDRELRTTPGEEYGEADEAFDAALAGRTATSPEPVEGRWGRWISVMTPLQAPDGRVEGVLGVDYPAAAWLNAARQARLAVIAVLGLCTLAVIGAGAMLTLAAKHAGDQEAARARDAAQAAALETARAAAQAGSEAKSAFLANMSHEIRTPMGAILGYLDLALGPEATPEERLDAAVTVRRNGAHLLNLINDILDLSKIEAGKMTVERVPCSPWQIAAEVASILRPKAFVKGIRLELDHDGPVPASVTTDPTRLRQVLLNLVGNAVKFTARGGVTVRMEMEGPALRVDVLDTGVGIRPEDVERLFAAFEQADASTTRKHGGTGLGLAISRKLASLMGGSLSASPRDGGGSVFTLSIDAGDLSGVAMLENPAEVLSCAWPSRDTPPGQAGLRLAGRILLAEDGEDNRRLLHHHLTKAGAEVEVARHGREALELAARAAAEGRAFDLVITDMQMPEMDGYETTRALRARGFTRPVIALTAHAMSGDREKCLAAGCDDYLSKPVDRERLLTACANWLSRRSRRAA